MSLEQRAQALVEQVDDAAMRLLANELRLVKLASNKEKSLASLAAETVEIGACTSEIIRATEDLLVISRGLKEAWILGQPRKPVQSSDSETAAADQTVHKLVSSLESIGEWL